MNKQELREHLVRETHRHTVIWGEPIKRMAADPGAAKILTKKQETRVKPANLRQEEWLIYLDSLGYEPE